MNNLNQITSSQLARHLKIVSFISLIHEGHCYTVGWSYHSMDETIRYHHVEKTHNDNDVIVQIMKHIFPDKTPEDCE
jgi:hypothetical protein